MDDNQRQNWWPDTEASQNAKDSADRETSYDRSGSAAQENTDGQTSSAGQTAPETGPDTSAQSGNESYSSGYGSPAGYQQNNWQNSGFQGNYYYGGQNYQPPRKPASAFSVASLVMGIISLLLVCCGLSYVFGALGIIFAILSRTSGQKMDSQASIGMGLSIAGSVIGIIVLVVYLAGNYSYIASSLENFENYQQYYYDGSMDDFYGTDDYDDYFDYYEDYFDGGYRNYGNFQGHSGVSFSRHGSNGVCHNGNPGIPCPRV